MDLEDFRKGLVSMLSVHINMLILAYSCISTAAISESFALAILCPSLVSMVLQP